MSVVIRLAKTGRKGEAKYRIVVAEKRSSRNGKPIETIGFYEKKVKGHIKNVNKQRLDYWFSQGAKPSPALNQLIKS